MADEAFALSPISARAALPSEADYDAIREAFMETSRGRWFLGEYAKRNRNADTSMVLDAVARIEETLAQRQQSPPPDDDCEEAQAAIRGAVDQASASISATLDGLGIAEKLAPIRKGARIVKEISWRWREIGADGRICDLLDSQVGAIEAGCEQISAADPRAALSAAFELIRARVDAFGDADLLAQSAEAVAPAAAPTYEMPAAAHEAASDADDEAVLDLVAMEMAAPDDTDDLELAESEFEQAPAAAAWSREAETAPARVERVAEQLPAIPSPGPPVAEAPRGAARESSPEPSLGSTIIASRILRKPNGPANGPLAPIRRMSQTEKRACFS